jgi:hypothetical protein
MVSLVGCSTLGINGTLFCTLILFVINTSVRVSAHQGKWQIAVASLLGVPLPYELIVRSSPHILGLLKKITIRTWRDNYILTYFKITAMWVDCSLADGYQYFGGICCRHHQGGLINYSYIL